MSDSIKKYQVVIVGGGPVGIFLGCCLEQLGISSIILEKRKKPVTHSRSLGIHPVSLELFQKLGFATSFVAEGVKIYRGVALTEKGKLGTISFEDEPLPFNFILSLPQFKTEALLEQHLAKKNAQVILRGATLTKLTQHPDKVVLSYQKDGKEHHIAGQYLVGCDGKNSTARELAGISFEGSIYPDTYLMGDFTDNTSFGNDAAIYLHKDGLIETFPLPGSMRRWVVKTDTYMPEANRRDLEQIVVDRIGINLQNQRNSMISSFGVQKLQANPLFKNRIILTGDAAHVVSPIGGQGMNLGWLHAWYLANHLQNIFSEDRHYKKAFKDYAMLVKRNTGKVVKRSELNMRLGRKRSAPTLRNALVWLMLNTPLKKVMAKLFTMRKLDSWPI